MSLSRAFTTRRARAAQDDVPKVPERKPSALLRHKISAPVQLIHTTNMLSYNAPDLPRSGMPRSASTKSTKSEEDWDASTNAESTPPTSPDVAPGEHCSSPDSKQVPSYFLTPPTTSGAVSDSEAAPAIPKRSPSHTKKNSYEALARQRSMSRISHDSEGSFLSRGATFSRSASTSTRASSASRVSHDQSWKHFSPPPPTPAPVASPHKEMHPFGQELAQVSELAEEYGIGSRLDAIDEEDQYMQSHGLAKFTPDDYLFAIQGLSMSFFPERAISYANQAPPLWI